MSIVFCIIVEWYNHVRKKSVLTFRVDTSSLYLWKHRRTRRLRCLVRGLNIEFPLILFQYLIMSNVFYLWMTRGVWLFYLDFHLYLYIVVGGIVILCPLGGSFGDIWWIEAGCIYDTLAVFSSVSYCSYIIEVGLCFFFWIIYLFFNLCDEFSGL